MQPHTVPPCIRSSCALASLIVSALAMVACAGDHPAPEPGEPVQAIPAKSPPMTVPEPAATIPADVIDRLRREVAGEFGLPLESVRLVSSEAVTWADSSLGCGGSDESALQVLTPGYRVALEAQGRRLSYHGDRRGNFRLCPAGRGDPPVDTGDTPVDR